LYTFGEIRSQIGSDGGADGESIYEADQRGSGGGNCLRAKEGENPEKKKGMLFAYAGAIGQSRETKGQITTL